MEQKIPINSQDEYVEIRIYKGSHAGLGLVDEHQISIIGDGEITIEQHFPEKKKKKNKKKKLKKSLSRKSLSPEDEDWWI